MRGYKISPEDQKELDKALENSVSGKVFELSQAFRDLFEAIIEAVIEPFKKSKTQHLASETHVCDKCKHTTQTLKTSQRSLPNTGGGGRISGQVTVYVKGSGGTGQGGSYDGK